MDFISEQEMPMLYRSIYDIMNERRTMSTAAFDTWFGEMHMISVDHEKIVFGVKTEIVRKVILQRYSELLEASVEEAMGFLPKIEIICDNIPIPTEMSGIQRFIKPEKKEIEMIEEDEDEGEEEYGDEKTEKVVTSGLHPEYTFDNFVVGSSNQLAHACSIAVSETTTGTHGYNPLFIYGMSGLGKTHLMYAIANRFHEKFPEKTVICVKSEDFLNEMVDFLSKKKMTKFRDKYRTVDMLLIDDVQFIAGKKLVQEEFFHTFEKLYAEKKQIVLTSDRPPKDMYTLEQRIQTRFEQGMIVDVQPPEYELRLAILRKKAEAGNLDIPTVVIEFLADKLNSNVREIEGAIKKIGAVSFLSGNPITLEMVKSSIPEYFKENRPIAETVDNILDVTARKFDVTVQDILGKSRTKNVKTARNVAMYVIKKVLGLSLPIIGRMMDRNHTTVLSNIQAIETEITSDDKLNNDVLEIIAEIKS